MPEEVKNARVEQLHAAAFDLLSSLENLMAIAMVYYRTLPDDGTEQDHVMTYYIEPARIAIHKATKGAANEITTIATEDIQVPEVR